MDNESVEKLTVVDRVLSFLDSEMSSTSIDSLELASKLNCDHQSIIGALKSIEASGDNQIVCEQKSRKIWRLTEEGEQIASKGSHEAILFNLIPKSGSGIEKNRLFELFGDQQTAKIGFNKAMSLKWIQIENVEKSQIVKRKVDEIDDKVQRKLLVVKDGKEEEEENGEEEENESVLVELKKRKLIEEIVIKSLLVRKGENFVNYKEKKKAATELTSEMIAKETWKWTQFKDYNFNAFGLAPETRGHLHPLQKVRQEFRQIFLEMGFSEMPTNNYVESSFWNFDTLYQPQHHPARDAQDTFFLSDPEYATQLASDESYVTNVKAAHENGHDYDSTGYQYDWSETEARKNVLRTHTTAVSGRMLYLIAQQYKKNPNKEFKASKYFSIDRVYRNETLDATHLAEFHQIEGLLCDRGISLANLIATVGEFFRKVGIGDRLRFKPAYNPYTEPSLEVFSFHSGFKKWVEIGNSGRFRPEMLLPMGLPKDVSVIGFGLSLERPTMIKYGIENIRDLVGHRIDLQLIRKNPVCILDDVDDENGENQ